MFGDYEPFSVTTVDRKYFTSDPLQFQDIVKHIPFREGGIIKNAVGEGMVAALEVVLAQCMAYQAVVLTGLSV